MPWRNSKKLSDFLKKQFIKFKFPQKKWYPFHHIRGSFYGNEISQSTGSP